jgi:hypothetical protein
MMNDILEGLKYLGAEDLILGTIMPIMDRKTWVHFPFSVRSLVALSRAETQHLEGEDLNSAVPGLLTVSVTTQVSIPSVMYATIPFV